MGAMENKGLNVFNSKYVLARTDTATDKDYLDIERVIGLQAPGHEVPPGPQSG
jgi:aminopeptidase N